MQHSKGKYVVILGIRYIFECFNNRSVVWFLTKHFKRKRRPLRSKSLRAANRRARQLSISSRAGSALETVTQRRVNTNYDWIDLQRKAAASAEKDGGSITSAATLIDGTPLTPQQLGQYSS